MRFLYQSRPSETLMSATAGNQCPKYPRAGAKLDYLLAEIRRDSIGISEWQRDRVVSNFQS